MSYETILYDVQNGVGTITLNRPETLNAFNQQMVKEAIQAMKAASRDAAVRCVVITGSGRGFSSGQDLMEAAVLATTSEASTGEHLRNTYHVLINQIVSLEKPVIAVLNGVAAGIGMSIALAADVRLGSDKATFSLGFTKIGLIPDGGANWILTRLIGYPRAYELALTNEKLTAEKALEWGLLNQVVPHEQLAEFTAAYTQKIAQGATLAFGLAKRAMRRGLDQTFAENLDYEAYLQDVAGRSEDCREGIMAFAEKRAAVFKGK